MVVSARPVEKPRIKRKEIAIAQHRAVAREPDVSDLGDGLLNVRHAAELNDIILVKPGKHRVIILSTRPLIGRIDTVKVHADAVIRAKAPRVRSRIRYPDPDKREP